MNLRGVERLFVMLTVIVVSAGCSGSSTTSVSATEVSVEDSNPEGLNYDGSATVEVTETEGDNGLFSILGDIIAWPFRVLGAAL